jgi:hypothetical protein
VPDQQPIDDKVHHSTSTVVASPALVALERQRQQRRPAARSALTGVVVDRVNQTAEAHYRQEHGQQRGDPDDD